MPKHLVVTEGHDPGPSWEIAVEDWWRVYEVNVLGVHLCCRAVIGGMLERGRGRIVITGSGAAYLPGIPSTAYAPSKAAACRYGETLAEELAGRIPVFFFSPGLVRTELNANFADDSWSMPRSRPAEIVDPEREMPGSSARICAAPMTNASRYRRLSISASGSPCTTATACAPPDARRRRSSAASSTNPLTTRNTADASGVANTCRSGF